MTTITPEKHGEMVDFLRAAVSFPSISTVPGFESEILQCASFFKDHLQTIGLTSNLFRTTGNPLVYGERIIDGKLPTVLFYGHYDVVKPGEASDWKSGNPFDLKEDNGRYYGRGAEDNKGQVTYTLFAIKELIKDGATNFNLKVILEGEEEKGSKGLLDLLKNNQEFKEKIRSDYMFACDTDAPRPDSVGVSMSLRGSVSLNLKVTGLKQSVHSGMYGGPAPNAVLALARIISSLHDELQQIQVPELLKGIRQVSPEEAAAVIKSGESDQQLKDFLGCPTLLGNQSISPQQRIGTHPTVDVTFFSAGVPELNSIPKDASARISARTAPTQDPEKILNALKAHLRASLGNNFKLEFQNESVGDWVLIPPASRTTQLFAEAIKDVTGEEAGKLYCGGSVPILRKIIDLIGADPALPGVGLPEDNIHDTNESFSARQLDLGAATIIRFFEKI